MEYINGYDLYQMFNYGTAKILSNRKTLNDINVFPVPDSDTGNNLASTMQTIIKQAKKEESFHHALENISESALYGARGNSGVIFAQFVNGLLAASTGKEEVTIEEFAEMVNKSVDFTYKSLSNPVEGTMLTVIKDWASNLMNIVRKTTTSIKNAFEQALEFARSSLEKTKERLLILKKNNVVDSGAMGFVLFLQGITSYYNKEVLEITEYEEVHMDHTHKHDETVNYRYCTEGLVRTEGGFNESNLRDVLNQFGDSLIIAKGLNIFRIHIHTNHPDWVFQELNRYGKVISQKVDNMILDINLENSKRKTLVITDSIADISQDYINEKEIVVIPINVNVDGVEYFDKLTMNNEILFYMIPQIKEYPTTSTPAPKYVKDLLEKVSDIFEEILIITVSANLSATNKVFVDAAKKLQEKGKKVVIVDSLNNSVTQGLLVKKAVELLDSGKSLEETSEIIEASKRRTSILVCLNTFKYATMSGRLPKVVGKIGNFFGMRPIMTLNKHGHGDAFGIAFSQKGITKKIIKLIQKELAGPGIESYGLVHCLNEELVEQYRITFTEMIGFGPEYITEVSSATAIHSGVGTVAIGYIRKGDL